MHGVSIKSNNKTWRLVFHWMSKKMRFWNAQTGGERWIIFILTFSDFWLQHYQLQLPVICFKNSTIGKGFFNDNLQNATLNSNYYKSVKYKWTGALSLWHQQYSTTVDIHGLLQTRGETRYPGRVSVSCLASRTRHEPIPLFSSQCSCYYTFCLFHFLSDIRLISGLMGAIAFAT